MNTQRLMKILLAPIVSEKSTMLADKHEQIAFKVCTTATKHEIKAAVELLFKVEVEAVRVVNIAGKQKRFGRTMGRRSDVRKAYVALKAGQEINFSRLRNMPLVKLKPTSPGRRAMVKVVHPHLHKGEPYAPLLERNPRLQVVTTMVALLPVTWAVVTSSTTAWLTSNATKTACQRKWKRLSTIQTVRPTLP